MGIFDKTPRSTAFLGGMAEGARRAAFPYLREHPPFWGSGDKEDSKTLNRQWSSRRNLIQGMVPSTTGGSYDVLAKMFPGLASGIKAGGEDGPTIEDMWDVVANLEAPQYANVLDMVRADTKKRGNAKEIFAHVETDIVNRGLPEGHRLVEQLGKTDPNDPSAVNRLDAEVKAADVGAERASTDWDRFKDNMRAYEDNLSNVDWQFEGIGIMKRLEGLANEASADFEETSFAGDWGDRIAQAETLARGRIRQDNLASIQAAVVAGETSAELLEEDKGQWALKETNLTDMPNDLMSESGVTGHLQTTHAALLDLVPFLSGASGIVTEAIVGTGHLENVNKLLAKVEEEGLRGALGEEGSTKLLESANHVIGLSESVVKKNKQVVRKQMMVDKAEQVAGLFEPFTGAAITVEDTHFTNDEEGFATIADSFWQDIQSAGVVAAGKVTIPKFNVFSAALKDAVANGAITAVESQELEGVAVATLVSNFNADVVNLDVDIPTAFRKLLDGSGDNSFLSAVRNDTPEQRAISVTRPSDLIKLDPESRERYGLDAKWNQLVEKTTRPDMDKPLQWLDQLAVDKSLRDEVLGEGGLLDKIHAHHWEVGYGFEPEGGGPGAGVPLGGADRPHQWPTLRGAAKAVDKFLWQRKRSPEVIALGKRLGAMDTHSVLQEDPHVENLSTFFQVVGDYRELLGHKAWADFVETGSGSFKQINVGEELSWGGSGTDLLIKKYEKELLAREVRIGSMGSLPSLTTEHSVALSKEQAEVDSAREYLGALKAQRKNSGRVNLLFGEFGYALTSGLRKSTIVEAIAGRLLGADPFTGAPAKDAPGTKLFTERIEEFGEKPGAFENLSNLTFELTLGNARKLVAGPGGDKSDDLVQSMKDQIQSLKRTVGHWATAIGELRTGDNWITYAGSKLGVTLPEELVIDSGNLVGVGRINIETATASNEDIAHWLMWRTLAERDPFADKLPIEPTSPP